MANYRTTVILKTDIVDSTPRLAGQTQAEMGAQRRQHKQFISGTAAQHRGSVFDEEGDAYWIDFPSVTDATLAAIDMHQNLRSMQVGKGEKQRLAIRAVITVGDILHQEKDTIGTTMTQTVRIEKFTPPDEIYLSHAAWLVLNKAEVQTSLVGEFDLKGFSESEKVYKVDQTHRTRVLTNQYIIFTDARGFTRFVRSSTPEVIENFILDCEDLFNDVCERHGGMVRQVTGDQYFITFSDSAEILTAILIIYRSWKNIIKRYGLGIAVSVHKGNLNVIRSYVYGDDIHTTVYLSEIARQHQGNKNGIFVVASGKVWDKFKGTEQESMFQKIGDDTPLWDDKRDVAREEGIYQLILEDEQ